MKITSNTSLQDLFEIAKDTLNELTKDEEFVVKDLFRGFEWNRIAGNRNKLGSMFFNFAGIEGVKIIFPMGKTPQNQQKYRKL